VTHVAAAILVLVVALMWQWGLGFATAWDDVISNAELIDDHRRQQDKINLMYSAASTAIAAGLPESIGAGSCTCNGCSTSGRVRALAIGVVLRVVCIGLLLALLVAIVGEWFAFFLLSVLGLTTVLNILFDVLLALKLSRPPSGTASAGAGAEPATGMPVAVPVGVAVGIAIPSASATPIPFAATSA
jgi:hypothetical protein